MRWTDIEAAWHDLADRIVLDWPELAMDQLATIAGNQAEFIRYLASRYDLTHEEAEEVVSLWLLRSTVTEGDVASHAA